MAAVLAVGEGAVLSHGCAANLHRLSPTCPPLVHVTVPGTTGRARRKGICLHCSLTLSDRETTLRHSIPRPPPQARRLTGDRSVPDYELAVEEDGGLAGGDAVGGLGKFDGQ